MKLQTTDNIAKLSDPNVEEPDIEGDDFDLELPVLPIEDDEKEDENYNWIIFVADYKLTSEVNKKLDKFLNIREFSEEAFKNRTMAYLKEQGVHYIWINLHDKGAREWLRKNVKFNDGYKMIVTYAVKQSKWVVDLAAYTDFCVSKKKIGDCSYLTLGELMDELRSSVIKIHKPLGGCFDKFIFKNRLISESKN
jgi:hypothetical protein